MSSLKNILENNNLKLEDSFYKDIEVFIELLQKSLNFENNNILEVLHHTQKKVVNLALYFLFQRYLKF